MGRAVVQPVKDRLRLGGSPQRARERFQIKIGEAVVVQNTVGVPPAREAPRVRVPKRGPQPGRESAGAGRVHGGFFPVAEGGLQRRHVLQGGGVAHFHPGHLAAFPVAVHVGRVEADAGKTIIGTGALQQAALALHGAGHVVHDDLDFGPHFSEKVAVSRPGVVVEDGADEARHLIKMGVGAEPRFRVVRRPHIADGLGAAGVVAGDLRVEQKIALRGLVRRIVGPVDFEAVPFVPVGRAEERPPVRLDARRGLSQPLLCPKVVQGPRDYRLIGLILGRQGVSGCQQQQKEPHGGVCFHHAPLICSGVRRGLCAARRGRSQ